LTQLEELDRKCFPAPVRYNRYTLGYYISLQDSLGLVDIIENRVIGFIIVTLTNKSTANIVTIDVDPLYRMRGIGSNLIVIVKKILSDWNMKLITLQVSVDNTIAVNFYKKHGFRITKTLPKYYPNTDGYHMEYMLG
jgi:ribosomal protein S18 acetylase RimI-like enzyme